MSPLNKALRTSHKLVLQFNSLFGLLLLISFLSFSGAACSSGEKVAPKPYQSKIFPEADKIDIWSATLSALEEKYEIKSENFNKGFISTKVKKNHNSSEASMGENQELTHSQIIVQLIQIQTELGPAIQVNIRKKIEYYKDPFSKPKLTPSPGLDEKVLLYRIERIFELKKKGLNPNHA